MNPVVYWRSALGLFWAFMFFVLLSLVIGMVYLSKLAFFPYAIFLSGFMLLFLTAFILFVKRTKAGFYMCLIMSMLFAFNQVLTLFFLLVRPDRIVPAAVLNSLSSDESIFFPIIISTLLLLWGLFLFFTTWKSKPVFEEKMKNKHIAWLSQLKKEPEPKLKQPKPIEILK